MTQDRFQSGGGERSNRLDVDLPRDLCICSTSTRQDGRSASCIACEMYDPSRGLEENGEGIISVSCIVNRPVYSP